LTSWVEISESSDERLRSNFAVLQEAAGGACVLAVIKADAYGHGLEHCARILSGAGAEWLGVTGVEEGRAVRRTLLAGGIALEKQPEILVMCGISEEDAEAIVSESLTPTVWTAQQIGWLAAAANRKTGPLGSPVRVHVEVDSGMSRQGARPGAELAEVVRAIEAAQGVLLGGLMTHFASAEVAGSEQTRHQRRQFEVALDEVKATGSAPEWLNVGNTSGVDLVGGAEDVMAWVERLAGEMGARAMTRSGLGLYGYSLGIEGDTAARSRLAGRLQPVMIWKAKVIGVEDLPAGAAVGYNGIFVTQRPMRLGLVAAGYADGLRRDLSSSNDRAGGWVMVRGQRAAIVGRVSMSLTTVDVSGIEGVRVGDEVVLLGEGVSAEDHARICGTISYEILCGVRAAGRSISTP
jgi:alanine racemase